MACAGRACALVACLVTRRCVHHRAAPSSAARRVRGLPGTASTPLMTAALGKGSEIFDRLAEGSVGGWGWIHRAPSRRWRACLLQAPPYASLRRFPALPPAPARPRFALMQKANEEQAQQPKSGETGATQESGSLQELYDLLAEFNVAMLVTRTPDGFLRARPMEVQDPKEMPGCDLWFVTADETPKVGEIQQEQQVAVTCYRPRDRAYVSISARARVEHDQEAVKRVWKPDWKAWIPGGPDDPHVALIKLTIEQAEYWEPAGGRLRVLYEMVKDAIRRPPVVKKLDLMKRAA